MQAGDLGLGWLLDLEDHVGLPVQVCGRNDLSAGLGIGRIGNGRAGACASLDQHVQPGCRQLAEHLGYQGDPPFSGRGFPGDADLHEHHLSSDGSRLGI